MIEFLVKILKYDFNSLIENSFLLGDIEKLENIDYNLKFLS